MSETFTLYKLIILYMLEKAQFPLTMSHISEFILDRGYTTYFTLRSVLAELEDSNLLFTETVHNRTLYHLSESGQETIRYFNKRLSEELKDDISQYLRDRQMELKDDVAVNTDCWKTSRGDYEVRCMIKEDGASLIDMTLTMPTKTEADAIAKSWMENGQEIYSLLLRNLL